MAMLAEKKQKVKWCLNPRGNDWAKDENKFGQRMLEKMGWQPGMGLGAKGQGRTDIVRLQIKNDTKGLGNKEQYDEGWTRQQQNFDSLLAELNGTDKKDKIEGSINIPSLEDKSKKSKARVHYHKFTRGKDVSKYSSKDLSSIIGIGSKQSENCSELAPEAASISMYDYFRNKSKVAKETDGVESSTMTLNFDEAPEVNNGEEAVNVYDQCEIKKKARRVKRKASDCDEQDASKTNIIDQGEFVKKKKKKKKRKSLENEEIDDIDGKIFENLSEEIDIEPLKKNINNETEDEPSKKKKKKRHKNKENNQQE